MRSDLRLSEVARLALVHPSNRSPSASAILVPGTENTALEKEFSPFLRCSHALTKGAVRPRADLSGRRRRRRQVVPGGGG